jgi:hypothetical protein
VTIHDGGQQPLDIQGIALLSEQNVPPQEDRWFAGPVKPSHDQQARATSVPIDLVFNQVPVSRILLVVAEPRAFSRPVEVDVSDDGRSWLRVKSATITRDTGLPVGAPLGVAVGGARGRYVRTQIMNADNVPLRVTEASVYGVRRTLLFPVTAGRSYSLFFGSDTAAPPQYDLPQVLRREPASPARASATLGPLELNPSYQAPVVRRPWTEEHPVVLWTIVAGMVVLLIFLILETVRKIGPAA